MTIWEFPIELTGFQLVHMPKGAKILSVTVQNGMTSLWAMVDVKAEYEVREFCVFGTGHPVDVVGINYDFIGTVFESSFVWHVFERIVCTPAPKDA